jgi:adenosylcobinamide kinase / adenosylcobinamide-phosphate guanylyltransferase
VPLTFLLGGARSGKSSLAIELALAQGAPVTFVATGEPGDDEMAGRIERHRLERPAAWVTVEEPRRLASTVAAIPVEGCLIVDCLTLWVANALEQGADAVEAEAEAAARAAADRPGPTFVVSNEVGLGIVPGTPLGREYRDVLGRVNAIFARAADTAMLVVAGLALPLKDVRGA